MSGIKQLIINFAANIDSYSKPSSTYNETETRVDFINPLFELLGWDMLNRQGLSRPLREVISEANIRAYEATKKPDYEFRLNGMRKFFVEAKKPSVDILDDPSPALQIRRYGWSANLPMSILTNFKTVSIYDCTVKPNENDNPRVGLLKTYRYDELEEKFQEIYDLISHESVINGRFDNHFDYLISTARGNQTFDGYFLEQIERWRINLARDLFKNNQSLSINQISYLVQVFLNRIVFLRICEDRNLEQYETLKNIEPTMAVSKLLELFRRADSKYDSGLFDLLNDTLTPSVALSNEVLLEIVCDLYYPKSPYSFSVVSPLILGSIYDKFISKTIELVDADIRITQKAEVKEAHGVFTTPPQVVNKIVEDSLNSYGGALDEAKILDPAVGSGVFLTEAYAHLLKEHLRFCIEHNRQDELRADDNGDLNLKLSTKRNILTTQIYGVDIDSQAVEVAKFSLYLKLLEDVPNAEITESLSLGIRALPRLENNIKVGNSLIDSPSYFRFHKVEDLKKDELSFITPFDWDEQFKSIIDSGGFDIVLANPPYTRIQNMMHYSPDEAHFYQSAASPYRSSHSNNFDKYQLFIERGYSLLSELGILSFVVPHKFMTSQAGTPLRKLLSMNKAVKSVVHFGSYQLFGAQATTYSCILTLTKLANEKYIFERPTDLSQWIEGRSLKTVYCCTSINENPWVFTSTNSGIYLDQINDNSPKTLESYAEIFVGLQTSADKIFIREQLSKNDGLISFNDYTGKYWEIEEEITKPAILDLEGFNDYSPIKSNRFIIFPYKYDGNKNIELNEDELKSTYPFAFRYLLSFKNELSKRSMQGNGAWYRFGRSQSLGKFNTEKLIMKNPALHATAALDTLNIMFTGGGNGPYYGVRPKNGISIDFLQALLNSDLFDMWVKARSSEFRGGYFSYSKQFMEKFPMPDISEKVYEVDSIVKAWRQLLSVSSEGETHTESTALQDQKEQIMKNINAKIYSLFEIDIPQKEVKHEGR